MDFHLNNSETASGPLIEEFHADLEDFAEDSGAVTSVVRRCYFEHVRKLLLDNYNFSRQKNSVISISDVTKYAQLIEMKALKSCMVIEKYRETLSKEVRIITEQTKNDKLLTSIADYIAALESFQNYNDTLVNSVTNSINNKSNTFKVENFNGQRPVQSFINNSSPENILESNYEQNIKVEPVDSNDENNGNATNMLINNNTDTNTEKDVQDIISSNLVKLNNNITVDDIHFGGANIQDNNATLSMQNEVNTSTVNINEVIHELEDIFGQEGTDGKEYLVNTIFGTDDEKTAITKRPSELQPESNAKMKKVDNFWRVEETIQLAILRQHLFAINEINPGKYDRVMYNIGNLFGEDEAPVSPVDFHSIKAACKDRITHHVVTNLTQYYVKNRIKSRGIFKQLSRSLVKKLLETNPYIDGNVICKVIQKVFRKSEFVIDSFKSMQTAEQKILGYITHYSIIVLKSELLSIHPFMSPIRLLFMFIY